MLTNKIYLKKFVTGMMGMAINNSLFYAAVTAVVVVHIILACFVYIAFTEDDTPRPEFKRD
jgi:hypothetical protein